MKKIIILLISILVWVAIFLFYQFGHTLKTKVFEVQILRAGMVTSEHEFGNIYVE